MKLMIYLLAVKTWLHPHSYHFI